MISEYKNKMFIQQNNLLFGSSDISSDTAVMQCIES